MLDERIKKAIKFFREFSDKSDTQLYHECVLKFCNLVEKYLGGEKEEEKEIDEAAKEVFGIKEEPVTPTSGD